MFRDGLINALIQRLLIPMTEIIHNNIPTELEKYVLVLEHEEITPVTYPREWSFQMVGSATLAFLDINEVALEFGYICKDAHLLNFIFCGMSPVWVDIGSLIPYKPGTRALPWLKEFYTDVITPLQMWSDGAGLIASRTLSSTSRHVSVQKTIAYRLPLLSGSSRIKQRMRDLFSKWYSLRSTSCSSTIIKILKWPFGVNPGREIKPIRKMLLRMRAPVNNEYLGHAGKVVLSQRFHRILQLI